jgi:hypothetical protein
MSERKERGPEKDRFCCKDKTQHCPQQTEDDHTTTALNFQHYCVFAVASLSAQ